MLTLSGINPLLGVTVIREVQLGIFHSHVALQADHVPLLEARSHCSIIPLPGYHTHVQIIPSPQ
jgi:hypothetical protein